jgi:hypothetical protein
MEITVVYHMEHEEKSLEQGGRVQPVDERTLTHARYITKRNQHKRINKYRTPKKGTPANTYKPSRLALL